MNPLTLPKPLFPVLILLLCASAPAFTLRSLGEEGRESSSSPLHAGAAATDITPALYPVFLRGSFSKRAATSAHDPLHARALVLSSGDTTVALVLVDSCMVDRDNLDQAKTIASKTTHIPVSNILVAATHTHSAPFSSAKWDTKPEIAYEQQLIDGIAQSIVDAHANLQPAEIGHGSHDEPAEVFNRRWFLQPGAMPANPFGETTDLAKMNPGAGNPNLVSPAGPIDPEVSVLSVRTTKGRPISFLGNYSLHYVGRIPAGQVSADYYGEFARLMKTRLQRQKPLDHFVGILSNGTSGDINNIRFADPRPPREPFEQIRFVASTVADAAYHAAENIEHHQDLPLVMLEREITLERRNPNKNQVARAKATIEHAEEHGEKDLPKLAKAYAERTLSLADLCKTEPTVDIKLQAIRIGDLAIVTTPFETFAEIGLKLKQESPFPDTFVIELANGAEGYLPTPSQHRLGGYETWLGTSRVEFNASTQITQTLLEMLADLKSM